MGLDRLTKNSIPGILCGIIILILTGLPGSCFPHVKPAIGLDKMAHGLMYAVFAFSCLWGYHEQLVANGPSYRNKAILIAIAIGIAYGGLTEIIQATLVPSRTGDWFDFVADIVGTCLGTYVFHLFFHRKK